MFNLGIKPFHKYLQALVLVLCASLTGLAAGCTAPGAMPSASSGMPVTGSGASFQVHEYPLVEESTDNPDHVTFQQRVPPAVSARQAGWPFSSSKSSIQGPNQTLAPFSYRLEPNPTPPFSGYALYHNQQLIQRDIARFWPVSVNSKSGGTDFIFSFETLAGERYVASVSGIHLLQDGDQSAGSAAPLNLGGPLAYADNSEGRNSAYAGTDLLQRSTLQQTGFVVSGDRPIQKGQFGLQMIGGQPFYFYARGEMVHINYAGRDIAYTYDQVVHGNTGSTAIFNPGGTGKIAWFYALRDGLWYYVEAGMFP